MKFLIRASARPITGEDTSIERVRQRLSAYPFEQVLAFAGRISAYLGAERHSTISAQKSVVVGLFEQTEAERVLSELAKQQRELVEPDEPAALPIAFSEDGLRLAIHIAATSNSQDRGEYVGDLKELAYAFIECNEIVEGSNLPEPTTDTLEDLRSWIRYLRSAAVRAGEPMSHRVARAAELFLGEGASSKSLSDTRLGSITSVRELFQSATGLDTNLYVYSVLGVLAQFATRSDAELNSSDLDLPYENWGAGFTPDEVRSLWNLIALDIAEFRAGLREKFDTAGYRTTWERVMRRSPCVVIGARVLCYSPQLLEDRLTDGLLYVFLAMPRDRNFSQAVHDLMGEIFESYISSTIGRILPALNSTQNAAPMKRQPAFGILSGEQLKQSILSTHADGKRTCDGVIVLDDVAVVFEVKKAGMSAAATVGDDPKQLFDRLSTTYVDAAAQLEQTIGQIAKGDHRRIGLSPTSIRRIVPVIVSGDRTPFGPHTRLWLASEFKAANVLQMRSCLGITIESIDLWDTSDVEWLEVAARSNGQRLRNIILARLTDGERGSLDQLLRFSRRPFITEFEKNAHLLKLFDRISIDAAADIARRRAI